MKELVERARTITGTVAEAIRRAVDPPLGSDPRPIDVRRAIIEAIERQLEPAGGGRRVLPGDAVAVHVLTEQPSSRRALEAVLADLRDAVVQRLREVQCDVPRRFRVDVSYVRRPPAAWAPDQRLDVVVTRHDGAAALDQTAPPALRITVLRGEAEKPAYTFTDAVVRVGRTREPTDDRGRLRFNDIAFLESGAAENASVGRGHACIRFAPVTGEHRLFDEGSANGTRVIRGGEVIEVPKRDPIGVVLMSGDEVQFGRAAIKLQIRES
jgi:hypothetical protein